MARSAADVQHGLPFVDIVPPDICLAIAARSAPVDIEASRWPALRALMRGVL